MVRQYLPEERRFELSLGTERNHAYEDLGVRAFQAEQTASAKSPKSETVWQIEGQAGLVLVEQMTQGGDW